jgi:hypothetical protein
LTILKRHHRLDDVVQTLQACGQWDLDTPPNGGIDTVELDADAGDAVRAGHAGDCSLSVAPGERLRSSNGQFNGRLTLVIDERCGVPVRRASPKGSAVVRSRASQWDPGATRAAPRQAGRSAG